MRRISATVVLATACLSFQGCFSIDVTLRLNPDGSGTLVERTQMQKQFLEQMKQLAEGFSAGTGRAGKTKGIGLGDMFSEEQVGKRAASYGPGVALVSARKISDATVEGIEAVYSFRDVAQLRLNQKPESMLPTTLTQGQSPTPSGMPQKLRFERLSDGNALLTLTIPWDEASTRVGQEASSSAQNSEKPPSISEEQLAQVKQMFQGMRVSLAVEPQGTLVRTNSPYVSGNRVTLFEMDMGEILTAAADPAGLAGMMTSPPASAAEARRLLSQFKGIKLCLEPEVRIEFSPR